MPLEPAPEIDIPSADTFENVLPLDAAFDNPFGELLDSGLDDAPAGGMYMALGFGDPWVLGVDTPIYTYVSPEVWVPRSSKFFSRSKYATFTQVTQEGGTMLRIESPGVLWDPGVYRVDLVSYSDGKIYPQLKPGLNSAVYGAKSSVRPEPDRRALLAASPAAPVGLYSVQVTTPSNDVLYAGDLELVHVPGCGPLRRLTALPDQVLRPTVPQGRDITLPWPANWSGGLYYALAKEVQFLGEFPETQLEEDFEPGDTAMVVVSTHGFANSGYITIDKNEEELRYDTKSTTQFNTELTIRTKTYPAGTLVRPVLSKIFPKRYKRGE